MCDACLLDSCEVFAGGLVFAQLAQVVVEDMSGGLFNRLLNFELDRLVCVLLFVPLFLKLLEVLSFKELLFAFKATLSTQR